MAPILFYLHLLLSLTLFPRGLAIRPEFDISEELDTEELGLGKQASGSCGFLIFSDVDDTMRCSKEKPLHGIDGNCRKKDAIYPGLTSFYWNLARGPEAACKDPPKVVPLSARPQEMSFALAIKAGDHPNPELQQEAASEDNRDWGLDVDNAIYGSFSALPEVLQGNFTTLANNKVQGWKGAKKATRPLVFIGDNGQGDVLAAMQMRKSGRPQLDAAFIHHVQPWASPTSPRTMLWKDHAGVGNEAALTPRRIFLFQNYAEAACRAVSEGLMRPEGYTKVMTSIATRCFGGIKGLGKLPANFAEVDEECRVLFPEFGRLRHGSLYIREPAACNRARAVASDKFGVLTGLLVWAGGWLSVGECTAVSKDVLEMIAHATQFVNEQQATASKTSDFGEFFHAKGVTTLLLQAVYTGFHCISSCEEESANAKKTFEDQHEMWTLDNKPPLTLVRVDTLCGGTSWRNLGISQAKALELKAKRKLEGSDLRGSHLLGKLIGLIPEKPMIITNGGRSILKITSTAER